MATWPKVKLADCVNLLAGFPFKSQQFTDKPDDLPLVKGENVSQGCILWDISKRWPALDWDKLEKFHLLPGDIIIAMDRPWVPAGLKWSFIRAGDPKALLVQRCARLRSCNGRLDQNFLRFVIGSPGFEGYVKPITTGVNVPHISGQQILDYEFMLPPLPVQRRIAGILSAYDELMENSQRRIRLLEAMARALYREWFVHFRFPGHEKHPRVASPLGDIPQGWEVKRLDALVEIKGGKQLEKEDIHETSEFPVFGGHGIQGYSDKATHRGFVIAFGRVGAYCGAIHWSYGGAWLNNNSSSVVPLKHDELVLHHLLHFNFTNLRGGAAQPFISNSALAGIELLFPGDALAAKFCSLVKPLRLQQVTLEKSVQNLRRTRDLLLPRLLSGQVPLP